MLGCQAGTPAPAPLHWHNPCQVWPVKSEIPWQPEFAFLLSSVKLGIFHIFKCGLHILWREPSSCSLRLSLPLLPSGVFFVRRHRLGFGMSAFRPHKGCKHIPVLKEAPIPPCPSWTLVIPSLSYLLQGDPSYSCGLSLVLSGLWLITSFRDER